MTQQLINVGTAPNDGLGDPLRTAFTKTNANFSELYAGTGAAGIANGTSNVQVLANSSVLVSIANTANVVTVNANTVSTTAGIVSTSAGAGIGYSTGAGGAVTQLNSKSDAVSLNAVCGQITMDAATLNAATTVSFVLNNTAINAGDVLILNHVSGGTAGSYALNAQAAADQATINVRNITAGNLGEAIVIGFVVIRAVTS